MLMMLFKSWPVGKRLAAGAHDAPAMLACETWAADAHDACCNVACGQGPADAHDACSIVACAQGLGQLIMMLALTSPVGKDWDS